MKIRDIARAIGKHIRIAQDGAKRQWVGDAGRMYLFDERITVTEENALAVLDIDEKQQKDYEVYDVGYMPQLGMEPVSMEEDLHPLIQADVLGSKTVFMWTEGGVLVAIPQDAIQPLGREKVAFRLRYAVDPDTAESMKPVVAVYGNMLCQAVIAPVARKSADALIDLMAKIVDVREGYCDEGGGGE